jgi:hypothetical protein
VKNNVIEENMHNDTKNEVNDIYIYSTAIIWTRARGGVVVEALRYKPEGHGFDSRWFHCIF